MGRFLMLRAMRQAMALFLLTSGWGAVHVAAQATVPLGPPPPALSFERAVQLSRLYLEAAEEPQRRLLLSQLAAYQGDFEPVIAALQQRKYPPMESGFYADKPFSLPELKEKYPSDLLYFQVPPGYDETRPTGLIVFMHGGSYSTSRDAPRYTLRCPTEESEPTSSRCGDLFRATGMVTVGPSAPGKWETSYRWCIRSAEGYLTDVVDECRSRFNLDPNRVFLLGHSMGGFGAYHQALRQPDRFAAILITAGSWDCAYWPSIRGTPLCIMHGRRDARPGQRWHQTDVEYARQTHAILTREGLEHTYYEHDGEHSIGQHRRYLAQYLEQTPQMRRDPYYPHVTLATPQGFSWNYVHPVRQNRWLELNETTPGSMRFDALVEQGDQFDTWRLEHRQPTRSASMIDAQLQPNNRIAITTEHVARLTVWLHPKMIDVRQPVVITVDGPVRFAGRVTPQLTTALESYRRRRDWGLIYPIKITLRAD